MTLFYIYLCLTWRDNYAFTITPAVSPSPVGSTFPFEHSPRPAFILQYHQYSTTTKHPRTQSLA